MLDELKDRLHQTLDHLEFQCRTDLMKVHLDKAIQKMGEATKFDKLFLPDSLLLVSLKDWLVVGNHIFVEICLHVFIIQVFVSLRQLHIHEFLLDNLERVEHFKDGLWIQKSVPG